MFKPELINSLKTYNSKTFVSDLIAGVIVGIVALPLAIAFAIIYFSNFFIIIFPKIKLFVIYFSGSHITIH